MKKTIAIFILLPLFSYPKNLLEKKIDIYLKNKINRYSKYLNIKEVKYIFPNKVSLMGISYERDGFSFSSNGLLEVNISLYNMEPVFSKRIILTKPQFSLKMDFVKKEKNIAIPNIEVIVENGRGNISNFGFCDNVSGYIRKKMFSFNGSLLGGKASIRGGEKTWKAHIKNAKISLIPFLPSIKKEGFADIILKKEKEIEIIADIKNGKINITDEKKIGKIKGRVLFKGGKTKGSLVFLYGRPREIKFDGLWKDNVFRIIQGNMKNTRFSGRIGKDITLSLFFNNEHIGNLKGIVLNGSATLTGSFKKPNIVGSFTLTKDNDVLDVFIQGDNNNLLFKTGKISLSGIELASSSIGTISISPFFISGNLVNPILFNEGKIEGKGDTLEISLLSEKRRLFIKMDGSKIKFRHCDIIKGLPLDCYGEIVFENGMLKVIIEYGKIGEIPINNGLVNIKLKDRIVNLELLIDEVTSIYSSFKITKDIDAPIFITNIKTEHIHKNLKAEADFKGRILGDIKKPVIFGQIYSPEPKLTADIIMIEDSLILKKARVHNTIFELSIAIPNGSISGFAEFEDEELSRISTLFPLTFPIPCKVQGKAIISGSLNNPEIIGSITVLNPLLFKGIQGDSMNLIFGLKDKSFSSYGSITSSSCGFVSFKTDITNGAIEAKGNISNFKIADIPIVGSLSFKGFYMNEIDGTLTLENILASSYKIPDIIETVKYQKDSLTLSGPISGFVKKEEVDILLSFSDFKIGEGNIKGTITVFGEIENPEINGEIEIKGKALKIPIFLEPFDEVSCKIKITEGIIRILSFKGRAKGGKIALQQIDEDVFKIKTEGDPIKIDIPGIIKGEAKCELIIEYIKMKSKGKITISNARFTYPPTKKRKEIPWLSQFIYGPIIEAGHNVWFYNEFCEAQIERGGFLILKMIDDVIKPEGSCHSRRGKISYLDTNFIIYDCNFEFRDGIPYLTGYANYIKDSISLTISHFGILSLPISLSLSSKTHPEKTQDELTKLLSEKRPEGFIAGIVSERIKTSLSRSISELTGINLEVITPFPEGIFLSTQTYTHLLSETEVKIGRYLTEKLYLIYECLIEGYEEERYRYRQRIGFEYDIGKRTGFRYLYTPKREKREEEHEIGIKKSISF